MSDLIVFMVNSYIRPTDIRNMQYKHVEIIRIEWTSLGSWLQVKTNVAIF